MCMILPSHILSIKPFFMKKITALCCFVLAFISCREPGQSQEEMTIQPLTIEKINAHIREVLQREKAFDWRHAPAEIVWSAVVRSDKIVSVGYKPAEEENIEQRLYTIDINNELWKQAKSKVLQLIWDEERKTDPELEMRELEIWEEDVLPVIVVKVQNYSTIQKLKNSKLVRYAEPMGYDPYDMENRVHPGSRPVSGSGCGSNTATPFLVSGIHYTTVSPDSKISWNYQYHGMQNAWTRTSGRGVKVFIIDTGCEFDQENLGVAFNQGSSSGRTIEKIVTLPRNNILGIPTGPVETPDDACGHGT